MNDGNKARDTEKAEHVVLGATRFTVVVVAAVACAPAGATCGAAAAIGVAATWDATESLIATENRGLIGSIDKAITTGSVDDIFNASASFGFEAIGGATGAKASVKFKLKARHK